MVKQLVFVASLLAGMAAAGLAVYIEMDSTFLTTPTRAGAFRAVDTPAVPAARAVQIGPSGETIFAPALITVDPVDIVVPVPGIKKPPAPKPAPQLATEPCSDWRDLGPKSSDTAKGEMHKVRLLCVS